MGECAVANPEEVALKAGRVSQLIDNAMSINAILADVAARSMIRLAMTYY